MTIPFQITAQMLEDFAQLTGDYNSLHLDPQYARRTSHRRQIVHGLLPVSFLSILLSSKFNSPSFFIKKITANFLQAIYTGQMLELVVISSKSEIQYTIKSRDNERPLTTGSVLLSKNDPEKSDLTLKTKQTNSLILRRVTENVFQFNDIKTGQQEKIPYCIHQQASLQLQTLISKGLAKPLKFPKNASVINNLLSTLMCSTLAGMRLPGRLATLLNLSIYFQNNSSLGQNQIIQGEVEFKSPSTIILIEKISFHDHNNPSSWGQGKLSIRMESPSLESISIAEIKSSLQDPALKDKVVLITGASRGIGAATAKMFSLSGAKVIVNYHNGKKDALAVVEDIQKNRGVAWAVGADVSDRNAVKAMVKEAQKKFGTIHVLVNNAAGNFNAIPFLNLTWDQIQNDLDVILKGAFNCCQEVLPLMLNNKGGKIINVGTIATEYPPVAQTKYVAAKCALVGLTRSLCLEFAAYNIQVNMVVPGMVETDLTKSIPSMIKEKLRQKNPMGRLATTIDVAQAIVMLAGTNTSYTTGQRFFVTGGESPLL